MSAEGERHNLSAILGCLKLAPVAAETPQLASENPFYLRNSTIADQQNDAHSLFGPHCGCSSSALHMKSKKVPEHAIFNQKQFKQRSKRFESKLLKPPTLELIGKCVDHGLVSNSTTPAVKETLRHSCSDVSLASATDSSVSNSPEDSLDESQPNSKNWSLPDGNFADFKSLIAECESLTLSPSTQQQPSQSALLHRTKSFRTHHTKSTANVKSTIHRPSSIMSKTAEHGFSGHNRARELGESSSCSSGSTTGGGGTGGASCSQQALLNEANCDVTIDELASYFETFVHIPKKMSVMAEMMYI